MAASNDSVPSVEAEEEGADAETVEETTVDRRLSEVWMDFDVLCKCFRLDRCYVTVLRNVSQCETAVIGAWRISLINTSIHTSTCFGCR